MRQRKDRLRQKETYVNEVEVDIGLVHDTSCIRKCKVGRERISCAKEIRR